MAWFATELVLSVILKLNLSLIALVSPVSSQPVGLELMFFIWNMALKVNIIRQCCETKWASSILLTFGILVLSALPIQLMLAQYFEQI
jgi:hypothetical protein